MLALLSPIQVYENQLKLKKVEATKQTLLQNNGEDVRMNENKMSHECETP
jgi:hypothetical protein